MENYVITVGREYGSGGRIIAEKVAKELGIGFYDKEIITMTAKESGFSEAFIQRTEQKRTSSFLYNLCVSSATLPMNDQVFLAQSETIKNICSKESCVIVGRCADYILRDNKNCLNIFIHADMEDRMKRVKEEYGVEETPLDTVLVKKDKERAAYYNHYTPSKWGRAQNYHLCINSGIGIDLSVDMIKSLVLQKFGGKNNVTGSTT